MSVNKSNAIHYCNLCHCNIDPLAWNEYYSSCIPCSVNILPFNHLDEPNFQSILNDMQQTGVSQDRLEDLHFDGFAIGDTQFGNKGLDPDANFFQNCSNLQSKYYDIDEFVSKFKDFHTSEAPFSSVHFNSRSVHKNFDKILDFLSLLQFDFDVIGLSETWLRDSDKLPNMPGYYSVCSNRYDKLGGGVGLYVKDSYTYLERPDLRNGDALYESIFIEICQSVGKNIVIGVVYKPPSTNLHNFSEAFDSLISSLLKENKLVYIMGDFNIDLLKYSIDNNVSDFVNMLFSNYYLPLITRPTRITNTTATLLDNIITNQFNRPVQSGLFYCDISDHLPVFQLTELNNQSKNGKGNTDVYVRSVSKESITALKNDLGLFCWDSIYGMENVNEAYDYFESVLSGLYNKHFPLKKKGRGKKKLNPWMTDSVLRSIKYKRLLYKKFLHKPSSTNESKYKDFRNTLNTTIRNVKKQYFQRKFAAYRNNIKATWKLINLLLNKGGKRVSEMQMKCNGELTTDSHEIANAFNSYFTQVGPNLDKLIPSNNSNFTNYLVNPCTNSIYFSATFEAEICSIVNTFRNNTASGIDGFSPRIIKCIIKEVSKPLCHIFNLSLSTGIFPDKLKIARVTPVFKSGDKCELSNYRPISVLPCFSKILEKIVYNRTVKFLDRNNILGSYQYGFRSKYSTSMALTDISNKIVDAFEENSFLIGVFVDLSKAFDTINHDVMLTKLKHYGIRGLAHNWYNSYLSNRCQCTKFKNCTSQSKKIVCGVPQGSLLGPLLFILYINDIANVSNTPSYILYADDTNILFSGKDLISLQDKVNENLDKLCKWFQANRLSVNPRKCNYIVFSNRNKSYDTDSVKVKLNNVEIPRVEKTKFLGVIIDSKLTWKFHIQELEKKLSKNIGIISRLSYVLPADVSRMLYSTLVLPYLSYCNLVWGSTFQSSLKKLITKQNKIVRIISGANPRSKARALYSKLKLLTLNDITTYQQCIFIYQCLNKLMPAHFAHLFETNQNVYRYNTRSSLLIHLPRPRTLSYQQNIRFVGPKKWNALSNNIRNAPSLNCFKLKLKKELYMCP